MTEDEKRDLVEALRDLLGPALQRSEPLRRVARHLGKLLIEEAERVDRAGGDADTGTGAGPAAEGRDHEPATERGRSGDSHGAPAPARGPSAYVPLRLGNAATNIPVTGTHEEINRAQSAAEEYGDGGPARDSEGGRAPGGEQAIDLSIIEQRARLKADSCRVYIQRRAAEGDPEAERDVLATMDEMIARAKAMPNCFLWAFWRERTQPDDSVLQVIAQCYDALAEAVVLVRSVDAIGERASTEQVRDAMQLMAEADSALRVALDRTWLTSPDVDQEEAHQWLRRESAVRRIYVPRHMRLDDPADPAQAEAIIQRACDLGHQIEAHAARGKQIDETFKKIRYHARQIKKELAAPNADGPAVSADTVDAQRSAQVHHYQKIAEAIGDLVGLGVPATDRRFRRVMDARVVDSFPADLAEPPARAVLDHLSAWFAGEELSAEPVLTAHEVREWSGRVHEVRGLLSGRSIVMIGGEPRNDAIERIRDAFDLDEVYWVRLTEHGSGEPMRAPIARPESALVLVLVKLAGHLHTEEAVGYAREAGKPCVMLKAGYNPEQIADAVLQQASEQLRQMAAAR